MTDIQERINRLLSLSSPTRSGMIHVRQKAVERIEASLQQEQLQLRSLKCAQLLSEFGLRMGQRILHNKVPYVLAEVDDTGNPVGHRIKADGSTNPNDKVALFKYRLKHIQPI